MFENPLYLYGGIATVIVLVIILLATRKKSCLQCDNKEKRFCVNCLTHTCQISQEDSDKTICACCKQ